MVVEGACPVSSGNRKLTFGGSRGIAVHQQIKGYLHY